MNELHEKFDKRGLAVIGVSDETAGKVKPYIEANGIKYIIALDKAPEYKSSGIPHAWLVSPKGEIVWEGHPSGLKEAQIEEHIKGASMTPQFTLPRELKTAESHLNAGKFADGIKALETHLKKPKSPSTETAAREALEQAKSYGDSRLKLVENLAKEQDYGSGAEILRELQTNFKGHEVGDKAKGLLGEWKKDAAIKLELDAASLLEQAEAQIQAKAWKNAAAALSQITRGKKFEGTKAREIAAKKLATVQRKL